MTENILPQNSPAAFNNAAYLTMQKQNKKIFSRIGLAVYALASLTVIFQTLIAFVSPFLPANIVANDFYIIFATFIPQYIIGLPVCCLILKTIPHFDIKPTNSDVGIPKFGVLKTFKAFCVSYGGMIIINLITNLLLAAIFMLTNSTLTNPIQAIITQSNPYLTFLTMCVLAPIIEELVFRKMIMTRLIKFGSLTAIIVSSLLFGLYHGNFLQCFYATAIGMVFAYVYTRTGKIIYSIILHVIINSLGTIIQPFLINYCGNIGAMICGLLVLITIVLGIIFFCQNIKKLYFLPPQIPIAKGKRFKTIFLNSGMILSLIIITIIFAINTVGMFLI